jgi:chromosome segregation protein
LPKSSGYIGNLADFIKTNNQYHGLINFLFGDTILVNDSSNGFNISSQGFKTVTLSGDLFENRSTIFETGYSSKLDEILSLVHDEASLSIVKEALKSLQKTISKRKVDIDQLQSESKKLTNERSNRKIMVERIKAETLTVNNFIRKYRSLEKGIKEQTKQYNQKGQSIDTKINVLKKHLETTNKRINHFKKQLQNMKMEDIHSDIASSEQEKNGKEQLAESTSRNLREVVTQLTRDKANLEHNLKPSFLRIKEQIENSEETLSEKQKLILESKGILDELSEKLKLLKKSERETIVKTKKSRPLLEKYDRRINILKKKRDNLIRSGSNIEKEILSTSKNIEILYGSVKNLRGELSLYGYDKPVTYFEMADSLLHQMNIEYTNLKNNVNLLAINSYQEIYSGYKNLSIRRNQLESERDAVVKFIEEVEAEKRHVFITSFEKIDKELRTIFAKLTGGSAWMELEDSDDIFSKGVFLMTQFPGKLPRESNSVSGGEKTVSALSMILAIQSVYPSPFYLFDEIDAHLDVRNSEKLADLLKERAESSQIIAVTLKDTILARANLVYGIYMEKGQSKIIKYRSNMEVLAISGK